MGETVAELDARIERLAREQAFAVEHRNWSRDAELAVEIGRLMERRRGLDREWRERPILFSAPMVRAILDGRKTQTRRLVTPGVGQEWLTPATIDKVCRFEPSVHGWWTMAVEGGHIGSVRCPYGQPGDRLWVREGFAPVDGNGHKCSPSAAAFVVLADGAQKYRDGAYFPPLPEYQQGVFDGIKWRPSIHMPRWACRIVLEVTDVRIERLKSITEADARAEGVDPTEWMGGPARESYCAAFADLWNRINIKRAPWSSNPWVWVVSFKRVEESRV
jgi:hypothetical protein